MVSGPTSLSLTLADISNSGQKFGRRAFPQPAVLVPPIPASNQITTPPTTTAGQLFLPVALAGVPLGGNVAVAIGETEIHGSTEGTPAELARDKGESRVRLTSQEKLLLVQLR